MYINRTITRFQRVLRFVLSTNCSHLPVRNSWIISHLIWISMPWFIMLNVPCLTISTPWFIMVIVPCLTKHTAYIRPHDIPWYFHHSKLCGNCMYLNYILSHRCIIIHHMVIHHKVKITWQNTTAELFLLLVFLYSFFIYSFVHEPSRCCCGSHFISVKTFNTNMFFTFLLLLTQTCLLHFFYF